MFGFFKKRKHKDQREHYRRAPGKKTALGVKLIRSDGAPVTGAIVDVSAGGAALRFDDDVSDDVAVGETREVRFTTLNHGSVSVQAICRSAGHPTDDKRYGFEFLDRAPLFSQLDETLYKFFNRRQWERAQPALDRRIQAEIGLGNGTELAYVRDLSMYGIGFDLAANVAQRLSLEQPVEITFTVPQSRGPLSFDGQVRHLTPTKATVRVGCTLEVKRTPENKKALKRDLDAMQEYIHRRTEEMERYNVAYN